MLPIAIKVHLKLFSYHAEIGIRDYKVTGVQTCALPISPLRLPLLPDLPGGARGHRPLRPAVPGQGGAHPRGGGDPEIGRASCRDRVSIVVVGAIGEFTLISAYNS